MVVSIVAILICIGVIAKICKMFGCLVKCCNCLGGCCCRRKRKVKVVKDTKGNGLDRSRPDTLTILKSPRSHRRHQPPRSCDTVEYASLNTSHFDSHGSYLASPAALARKEAEVRNQAKRVFEARRKYERLRSVSVGEIGSQSCPLEDQQQSASLCLLPTAPPQIWVLSPNSSSGAISSFSSQVRKINDLTSKRIASGSTASSQNGVRLQNETEQMKTIKGFLNEQGTMNLTFQARGAMLDELDDSTPDSSIASSPTNSTELKPQNTEVMPSKKPLHLRLPSDIIDFPSTLLPLPTSAHRRTLSSSPGYHISSQSRNPTMRRASEVAIFRFDNLASPRPFTSDAELDSFNPLKPSIEYNGGTPPNSPLIVSQVAEQFI